MQKTIFTRHYDILISKMRAMREAAGLNQRELAKLLGREQTLVARIEQGQRRIDMIEFYSYCQALGVDVRKAATQLFNECLAIDKSAVKRKKAKR